MWYVTHEFAHPETLERARRWLVQAGFDPSRIEVYSTGTPRLAIAVDGGEAAEVELLIDAAEATDPEGYPSFWELAHQPHLHAQIEEPIESTTPETHSESFVVSWRPLDTDREVSQTTTDLLFWELSLERGE